MDATSYQNGATPSLPQRPSVRFAFAGPRDGTGVSLSPTGPRLGPRPIDEEGEGQDIEPIQLGLAIRRRRLVGFTVAMLALIISITVWFHSGMALTHFESRDKDSAAQIKLLDEYNAYAGHIATLFGTPIELFVTVAVQLIVLRAMAERFARPEMSWKISVVTLAIGAGVGYMISNGFNALNVQLRPQQIRAIVSQADLGLDTIYDKSYFQNRSALFEYKRVDSEMLPKNPVTNTLLRTLLVPTEPRRDSGCARVDSDAASVEAVEESFLHRGFPQRDWQGRILQEALASDMLRMDVDASSATDEARTVASLHCQ